MEPLIRIDLEEVLNGGDPVIVELGCGRKKKQGRIGIDRVDLTNVDIVADMEEGLSFLPDNPRFSLAYAYLFFYYPNLPLYTSS